MTENVNQDRRKFLKSTGGVAAAIAVAGCSGDGGGNNDSSGGNNGSDGGGIDTGDGTEGANQTSKSSGSNDTDTNNDSQGSNQQGGVMYQLVTQTMDNFDPIASTSSDASVVIAQVYDTLIDTLNGELPPEPLLAKDYEVSNGGKTYRFSLKEGVTFHNGDELTASDVEYSWNRLADSPNTRRSGYFLNSLGIKHETKEDGSYKKGSVAVKAVDEYTFEMTLSRPYAWATEILGYKAFSVIPEGIVGDLEGYDGEFSQEEFGASNPIGSGPFEFDHWNSGTEVEVTKFDDYHAKKANIDGVHWQIISDTNASYNYSMNKNSDNISIPLSKYNPDKVSVKNVDDKDRKVGTYGPLRNGETVNYLLVPDLTTHFIGFQTDRVEKPARQAVAHVANQSALNQNVAKGTQVPAFHTTPRIIYPGGSEAAKQHTKDKYPYGFNEAQIDAARQVMEGAGYSENNRYSFTVFSSPTTLRTSILGRIRDKLASAHIDLKITTTPFSTYWGAQKKGNFDAMIFRWGMGWSDPANILALNYPPNADASADATQIGTNWSDTEASKQAKNAYETYSENARATEEDKKVRKQMVNKMEEAIWEDVPMTPLLYPTAMRFTYDWVDVPKFGIVGSQKFNGVKINAEKRP